MDRHKSTNRESSREEMALFIPGGLLQPEMKGPLTRTWERTGPVANSPPPEAEVQAGGATWLLWDLLQDEQTCHSSIVLWGEWATPSTINNKLGMELHYFPFQPRFAMKPWNKASLFHYLSSTRWVFWYLGRKAEDSSHGMILELKEIK